MPPIKERMARACWQVWRIFPWPTTRFLDIVAGPIRFFHLWPSMICPTWPLPRNCNSPAACIAIRTCWWTWCWVVRLSRCLLRNHAFGILGFCISENCVSKTNWLIIPFHYHFWWHHCLTPFCFQLTFLMGLMHMVNTKDGQSRRFSHSWFVPWICRTLFSWHRQVMSPPVSWCFPFSSTCHMNFGKIWCETPYYTVITRCLTSHFPHLSPIARRLSRWLQSVAERLGLVDVC